MMLKRFVVCAWDQYYPNGGLDNIRGAFHEREDAEAYERELLEKDSSDFVKVYDLMETIIGRN